MITLTAASALLFIHTLSGGSIVKHVDVVPLLGDDYGYVSRRNPRYIQVTSDIPKEDTERILAHETGHSVDFLKGCDKTYFGRAPFVSEYAKKNKIEDFAESYSWWARGKSMPAGSERKIRAIESCLLGSR